jgi:hypothetical protein
MGIDAQLRAESGEVLSEVGDGNMVLSRATNSQLSSTRLLRYLVPWGDAIFEPLVERLAKESHLYLWFVGD